MGRTAIPSQSAAPPRARKPKSTGPPKPAGFEFVSISHPDDMKERDMRRKISRHVMKDIGVTRRRKPAQADGNPRDLARIDVDRAVPQTTVQNDALLRYPQPRDPFELSPINALSRNFSARAQKISRFLTRPDSPMCKQLRALCFTLALVEDGPMYIALADLAVYDIGKCQKPNLRENPFALSYYTTALRLLSQQIMSATKAICDGIIGTVASLASYDLGVKNPIRWSAHMDGLKTMVDGRGGIEAVDSEYVLGGLVWCGIVGCITIDVPPKFAVPSALRRGLPTSPTAPFTSKILNELQHRSSDFATLCSVFEHMSVVTKTASTLPVAEWLGDHDLQPNFLVAAHKVLSMPRFSTSVILASSAASHTALIEVLRLAMLLFILGPISKTAGNHEWELNYCGRIPSLLRMTYIDWSGLEDLELWVLIVAALHERGDDRNWLLARLSQNMSTLRLGWEDALNVLRQILWLDEAFDMVTPKLEEDLKTVARQALKHQLSE